MFRENGLYFVTVRTLQARMLLTPSDAINGVLGGVLARAAELHSICVYGFVFMSNHVHLLVGAEGNALAGFMRYLLGNIARKVGKLNGWSGRFWGGRYSAQLVLDDESAIGRLKYILAHGVKEGLVTSPTEWPGLSSLEQLLGEQRRRFPWYNWSKRWNARRRAGHGESLLQEEWAEPVYLELKPLPCWKNLSEPVRRQRVRDLIDTIVAEGPVQIEREGHHSAPGREQILKQHPHTRPAQAKRSPRPLCHAAHRELRKAFLETYRGFVAMFREASARWKAGDAGAEFPPYAFKPGLGVT
jgi:REP element-mobilizing transposase RayT